MAAVRTPLNHSKNDIGTNTLVSDEFQFLLPKSRSQEIEYYPFNRNWTKRIMPCLGDKEINEILVRDFNKFTWGRWRKPFLPGMFPDEMESCYWNLDHRGRHPRYWRYVKHAACHWLINFALRLAMLAEPKRSWRIVTSDKHSAVWDSLNTLFDLQGYSLSVPVTEICESLKGGVQLRPGQYVKVNLAQHYTREDRRRPGVGDPISQAMTSPSSH